MKTMTIAAVMALLVAIPLILGKKGLQSIRTVSNNGEMAPINDNQRYDIEDFLT